jgi:outer membrane assembly lipoprotein YfiO
MTWMRLIFAMAAVCAMTVHAVEPQTIELRGGRYWETVKSPTTAPVTDETLDRVGQLLESNNPDAAKKMVLNWIKLNKQHPLRDRAVYLLGLANYQRGDRMGAFYNFEEVMDVYPESKYFYPSLDKQYQIADAFLSGYKRRVFLFLKFGAEEEAIEMMYRIQQRSPGSPLAEKALKRTADYYYADAQYDLAADAYQAFIERYRRSPEVPQAKVKRAFAMLAQFTGTKFDPTPVINARTALEEIASDYPELARQENVAAVIERIDGALARKVWQNTQFYMRTREPRAAAYNCRYLIKNYPNSPEAGQAKELLASLPASLQAGPEPTSKPVELRPQPELQPERR